MRAVTFQVTVPRYLAARSLGRVTDAVLYGRLSGVRLQDVAVPPLPGPAWLRLKVLKAGICGTDVGTITYSASPALEPFGSFPAVLGHEILAEVVEAGIEARDLEVGSRVAVDPMISCGVRDYPRDAWCRSCSGGRHCTCENAGETGPLTVDGQPLAAGLTIGYHRSLPGGWSEALVAHRSQCFPVAPGLDDHTGVLIEPLSIGLHAVLNTPTPHPDEPILIIGSGPIAMGALWALRATGFQGEIVAQTKRSHEARLAGALGATNVVAPGAEARDALVRTGAQAYMPIIGPEVYAGGGFPVIYDCVGSAGSIDQALRYAAPRGRIVLLGCAARIPKLDLTFLWARELNVRGFVGYGQESFRGEDRHTFQIAHDLLLETGA
ncbi:MAG TPA: alcohol dehydrogenase catalytic domain-containing protein, partial [Longimicrobiales bacterium]